jgi:hypothetical protein
VEGEERVPRLIRSDKWMVKKNNNKGRQLEYFPRLFSVSLKARKINK